MLCYLLLLLRVSLPLLTGLLEEPGEPAGVWLGWLRVMRVLGVCGGVCVGCGPPPGPGGALSPFPFWLSEAGCGRRGRNTGMRTLGRRECMPQIPSMPQGVGWSPENTTAH